MIEVIEDKEIFKDTARVVFDTRTDNEDRTKWLQNRCNSIGGSEIAKVVGKSKYGSPLSLYNEKTSELPRKKKDNIHTKHGNRMEPLIKQWLPEEFKLQTNIDIKIYDYPFMMVDKDYSFISANLDGLALLNERWVYESNNDTGEIKYIEKDELIGIEVKTASEFLKQVWEGEEIPDDYYCQVQYYMGITGLNNFLIVYMIGKEIKWKVIPRCESDIKILKDAAIHFWGYHLILRIPPAPSGFDGDTKIILRNQSLQDDEEKQITQFKLMEYNKIDKQIKDLEKEKEKLKQEIYLEMGDSRKGTDGYFKVSRYKVNRTTIDQNKLKIKHPEVYEECIKSNVEYVNLKVTKLREG